MNKRLAVSPYYFFYLKSTAKSQRLIAKYPLPTKNSTLKTYNFHNTIIVPKSQIHYNQYFTKPPTCQTVKKLDSVLYDFFTLYYTLDKCIFYNKLKLQLSICLKSYIDKTQTLL